MAEEADVTFTFNASEFKTAMEGISNDMKNVAKNTGGISKKMGKGMGKTLTAVGLKFGLIIGAIKGVGAMAKNFIPEIGTAFQIAGNIFMKNFLQPLRMLLLPILNKILKWVRESRPLFVKLGSVFLNVLKSVVQILKTVFNLLKKALEPIINVIKQALGGTVDEISDTINLLLVKITAFTILLEDLLAPVFGGIAEYIEKLITLYKRFGQGLVDGIKKYFQQGAVMETLENFKLLFQNILETMEFLAPAFEVMGKVVGVVLVGAFNILIDSLNILIAELMLLFDLMDPSKREGAFKRFGEAMNKAITQGGTAGMFNQIKQETGTGKGAFARGQMPQEYQDVIITKKGDIIRTSPEDMIMATKGGLPGGGPSVSVTVGDIHVTTTEGDAKQAGINFMEGIEQTVRNSLLNSLASEAQ